MSKIRYLRYLRYSSYSPHMLAMLLLPAKLAYAQTTPDAGSLLQQMEKNRAPGTVPKVPPSLAPLPQPMRELAGNSVTVSVFQFAGNTLLSSEQLAPAVAAYLNRPLDFSALQTAAAAVAETYRKAGSIVRVYLPRQEINNGVVTFQIVEAVFGGTRFVGPPPSRLPRERVLPIVDGAQPKGQLLNAAALDRALLLIDDLPGITVDGSLTAGEEPAKTDLLLKLVDEPLLSGMASADNTGSRSAGAGRGTADQSLNSPLHIGERLDANLIASEGTRYGRLSYTLPVGASGARVGVNASYLKYKLVSDDTEALAARGRSSTVGLEASYPLVRERLRNLSLDLAYDSKRFNNEALATTITHYRINTFTATQSGNLLDSAGGGGNNNASLAVVRGSVDLEGSPNQLVDSLTARTDGQFTKLRYYASRQQVITEALALFASVAGQSANKNLDSAEKFYLGGAYGVRAYPSNEGAGNSGQLVTLELRGRLPGSLTLSGFYDWGRIRLNHDNGFWGAPARNSYSLKGAGVSAGWLSSTSLGLKATWARRIGANPSPSSNGSDQDGTLHRNRIWLQASLPF
jgi:hemolysin activation/secretion protein